MKFLVIFLITMFGMFYSCSKKPEIKKHKIKISFAKSKNVKENARIQHHSLAVSRGSTGNSSDGDDWGYQPPASVSDISCIGVRIHDNEGEEETCILEDGTEVPATKLAGFVKSGGSIDVEVKVGEAVKFYVYGMYTDNGECPSIHGDEMDDMEAHLSEPVQMGSKIMNIDPSVTEVNITTNYAKAKIVEKCDGDSEDDHGDSGSTGPEPDPLCDPSNNTNADSSSQFASGAGSVSDPYLICNYPQLQMMNTDHTAYYEIGADIQASGGNFTPVATCSSGTTCGTYFSGSLNGRGFTIWDLTIDRSQDWTGLFGQLASSAVITNIKLANVDINNHSNSNTGVIAGYASGATISDIFVSGSLAGRYNIGGLVGTANGNTKIYRANIDLNIGIGTGASTLTNAGGAIGNATGNIASDPIVLSEVGIKGIIDAQTGGTVNTPVGGLIGTTYVQSGSGGVTINDAYNNGAISGRSYIGGLVGRVHGYGSTPGFVMTRTYNSGSVTNAIGDSGGLIGISTTDSGNSSLSYSFSTGVITGGTTADTGAIVGSAGEDFTSSPGFVYFFDPTAGWGPNGTGGTAVSATEEATESNLFDSSHPVYSGTWDFTNTWLIQGNSTPILKNIPSPPMGQAN